MKKKILNVGVISCSNMAQSHMLAVKNHEQACLAAICDVDEEKLREAGDKIGVEARMYPITGSCFTIPGWMR